MVCSTKKEVSSELLPFLQVYKDGSVERFLDSPYVPPTLQQDSVALTGAGTITTTGVISKDITITPDVVSARIYLPADIDVELSNPNIHHHHHQKLPVLVYFHGGGFCIESAFSFLCHRYINALVSHARILVVSVEYRRAPEHPLPAAYEDSWTALQWIASQSIDHDQTEPWLSNYANFNRVFVGGDSAGANIAHNLAMRASLQGLNNNSTGTGMKCLYGVLLSQPYFLDCSSSDDNDDEKKLLYRRTWKFAYPNAPGGVDNPLINPFSGEAPSLSWLGEGCSRLMVCVAEKDELREIGIKYFDAVKKSSNGGSWKIKNNNGRKLILDIFEVEGEDHCFHIFNLHTQNAQIMIKRFSSFLNS